jgi:hypothetical protein
MKKLLLRILSLPVDMFLLLFIGTLLLNMRLFNIRWGDKYLTDYKAYFVETATLGLCMRA